jgi:AraC-like DNA-binding protein
MLAPIHEIRSIYARDQGIRMHGLKVHRLRLNRHLPKVDRIATHSHRHSQLLMYLAGAGCQQIGGQTYEIRRGSLFFVPPHTSHSFVDTQGYKPLCLALDLDVTNPAHTAFVFSTLSLLDLKRVRQELAHLNRWRTGGETVEPREAAAVLRLIDVCFRSLGLLAADSLPAGSHLFKSVQRILHEPASWREPLGAIARRAGYQPDYLNRMLKQVCGLTLGELRDTIRLRTARRLLANPMSIADVAGEVGFDDPNYFSRWFRGQTGYTPSDWRAGAAQQPHG